MATKKVYDACCRMIRRQAASGVILYGYREDGKMERRMRPNMYGLFGHKCLVTESEFSRCSESEKRCHLFEDELLAVHYLKRY